MSKIIVYSAHKGGCSKTVTTHNLAVALARLGHKVLAVDMDCQANLMSCLGMENIDAIPIGIAYLLAAQLEDETLPEKEMFIQHCDLVDLIPANSYLSAVSETMRLEMCSEHFLAEFAAKSSGMTKQLSSKSVIIRILYLHFKTVP